MTAVRVFDGWFTIDVDAWLGQRLGEQDHVLSHSLSTFTRHQSFGCSPHLPVDERMLLWCSARDWSVAEGSPIEHDDRTLTRAVSVVLACGPEAVSYALVLVEGREPAVFVDRTMDDAYWRWVRPVDIACAHGHTWTWLDDDTVLDTTGNPHRLVELFKGRATPFERCRQCAAHDTDPSCRPCSCTEPAAVYCPLCASRCRLELTDVPVFANAGAGFFAPV
ncbi:hypothetical protein [Catellatospora methionotrophica]|uniref:hypothetical protein n=1 Tax=Catellatospora methionotrophica TaxID=121620 RepID=UPI0033DC3E24